MRTLPKLFVDKLSLTIPIVASRHEVIRAQLADAVSWSQHLYGADARNSRYRDKYRISIEDQGVADIFVNPQNDAANFMRIEYSPNNLGEVGRRLLGAYLQAVLGSEWRADLMGSRVTRTDWAIDIHRTWLDDLLVVDLRPRRNKTAIYRGLSGAIETYYSPHKGTNQFRIYDKLQALKDDRGAAPAPRKIEGAIVRFEYSQRKIKYPLASIAGRVENPFHHLEVKKFAIVESTIPPDYQRLFFDACRLRGVENVLAGIQDVSKRGRLEEVYSAFPVPLFMTRRTSVWQPRRALNEALPIDPNGEEFLVGS